MQRLSSDVFSQPWLSVQAKQEEEARRVADEARRKEEARMKREAEAALRRRGCCYISAIDEVNMAFCMGWL
jgi:hypothetical protein